MNARGGSVRATLQGREAGAGAGGRIAVAAATNSYTGALSVAGGVAYNSAGTSAVGASYQGGAGTLVGP